MSDNEDKTKPKLNMKISPSSASLSKTIQGIHEDQFTQNGFNRALDAKHWVKMDVLKSPSAQKWLKKLFGGGNQETLALAATASAAGSSDPKTPGTPVTPPASPDPDKIFRQYPSFDPVFMKV